ncbi:MAG: hypothetical protein R3F11_03870 [Verrucomicrobiales bacterium]
MQALQGIYQYMVADLPGVLKSCDGFSAITAIPELIQLRETAEKLFPDEAKDYCQALFEFAEQVALRLVGSSGLGKDIQRRKGCPRVARRGISDRALSAPMCLADQP